MKLIDKIRTSTEEGKPFYSFEYFPPKTVPGLENLYDRIERMSKLSPIFLDITWGAGGSTAELSLEIASNMQNLIGLETQMHLTCTKMSRANLIDVLAQTREKGIQNILALRGDPVGSAAVWEAGDDGFRHAVDLVRLIREEHGDYFGICVAGYPEGHVEAQAYKADLGFLKAKVDAGADLVISQLFYDADVFLRFVDDCRAVGIECPIIPGIMPIQSYSNFTQVTRFCRTVPDAVVAALEPIQNDDEAVKEYGVSLLRDICQELLDNGVPGLHFYTMNLERAVTRILDELGVIPERVDRPLPWRSSANVRRTREDVRPIFWANRPKSYLARTMEWDEFPNGRWGDARSPAFGGLTDYHLTQLHLVREDRLDLWGRNPRSLADVCDVFVRFCEGKISAMPWFDSPLAKESVAIRDQLIELNRNGLLTVNSQPRVNGAPSEDPSVGWGGAGGRVYQKAYFEFFVSDLSLPTLLAKFGELENLSFHAINKDGDSFSNCDEVNAVTWGVFAGSEIKQPTVVDPASFIVWKDEAFALWMSAWGSLYPEGSDSRRLLEQIHDTFYLVNVVDNDFEHGDLLGQLVPIARQLAAELPKAAAG